MCSEFNPYIVPNFSHFLRSFLENKINLPVLLQLMSKIREGTHLHTSLSPYCVCVCVCVCARFCTCTQHISTLLEYFITNKCVNLVMRDSVMATQDMLNVTRIEQTSCCPKNKKRRVKLKKPHIIFGVFCCLMICELSLQTIVSKFY